MSSFIRFQTPLRCAWTNRPAGLFAAAGQLEDSETLVESTLDRLREHLTWFNQNLRVPALDEFGWRCIFWFRSDASEFIGKVWDVVAILREEGVSVRKVWTTQPGRVVYADRHQIAAVPFKNSIALRV